MKLQETVSFVLPVTGQTVVIRGYMSGRTKQAIETTLLGDSTITPGVPTSFKGDAAIAARNKAIEVLVVSVDGQTANLVDTVLDLPGDDYDKIVAEVNKIQNPLAQTTGPSLPTPTTSTSPAASAASPDASPIPSSAS